jgi:hypothetical protein
MFEFKNLKFIITIAFVGFLYSQSEDTLAVEEETGEMYTNVEISFSEDQGNTNFRSLYYGFDYTLIGDAGPLKDTELFFAFNRTDDLLDGEPFSDDQSITLKFDVWANQRFSPFLFFQKTFDKTTGLQNRQNLGIGAKLGIFKGLSLSYAFLSESETYDSFWGYTDSTAIGNYNWAYTDSVWYGEYDYVLSEFDSDYYYWITPDTTIDGIDYAKSDSTLIYADYYYSDSTLIDSFYVRKDSIDLGAQSNFFRHSFRPKIKLKFFEDNLVFDYRFYYKPRVDNFEDFLLEHELKISLTTFYEAINLNLNFSNKYNSRYDPSRNTNKGVANLYDMNDQNITIGFEFSF